MKIKSQSDFWSGLMFIAIGVGFAMGRDELQHGQRARRTILRASLGPMSSFRASGARLFPLGLSSCALLGAIVLFKSLTIETEGGDPVGNFAWRPLVFIIAADRRCFGLPCSQPLGPDRRHLRC